MSNETIIKHMCDDTLTFSVYKTTREHVRITTRSVRTTYKDVYKAAYLYKDGDKTIKTITKRLYNALLALNED